MKKLLSGERGAGGETKAGGNKGRLEKRKAENEGGWGQEKM